MTDLRPYYDPSTFQTGHTVTYHPGIGVLDQHGQPLSSKLSKLSTKPYNVTKRPLVVHSKQYSDLELGEYFDTGNFNELVKSLVHGLVKGYGRLVVSQPFEVVRLLLQVASFDSLHSHESPESVDSYDLSDEDDDIDYFQPKNEREQTRRTKSIKRSRPKKVTNDYLKPMTLNTMDVMSALLSHEGIKGLWRSTNTSFIYTTLQSTLEAWFTGVLSVVLHIPDPFFISLEHSPDPLNSLVLSIGANVVSQLVLAPLDLIRTKFIVTSMKGERSLRKSIKGVSYPYELILPILFHSIGNNLNKVLLFLCRSNNGFIKLLCSLLGLMVKLPTETILRRAQVSCLLPGIKEYLIVKFDGYSGPWTPWNIFRHRGFEGLYKGWRVGVLNLLGNYGLEVLRISYDDQILKEEKF
jgi:fusion and transport protein UGO1